MDVAVSVLWLLVGIPLGWVAAVGTAELWWRGRL
jgi:hypothetical protein